MCPRPRRHVECELEVGWCHREGIVASYHQKGQEAAPREGKGTHEPVVTSLSKSESSKVYLSVALLAPFVTLPKWLRNTYMVVPADELPCFKRSQPTGIPARIGRLFITC